MKNSDFLKRYKSASHNIENLVKQQHNPFRKLRILAYMDSPCANTGFGVVARNILTRLYKTGKYEIECLGINHFSDFLDQDRFPFQIVPARLGDPKDPYGLNMFLRVLDKRDYDIVFIMNDTFVVEQISGQLKKLRAAKLAQNGKVFKIVYYYPIDCRAIPGATSLIEMADKAVAYSDFAIDETRKIIKREDIDRIYLGVDTDLFKPLEPEEREFFRKKYFNISDDTYVFINVNRNSPRKDVAKSIFAFSEFRKEVPKSILYLHMAVKDAGAGTMTPIDLSVPVQHLNLGDNGAVRFPANFFTATGVPEKDLRTLYCSADAFITSHCFEGETPICLSDTISFIKDIKVGDKVFSHQGKICEVLKKHERDYEGDMIHIKVNNISVDLKTTPEHPFRCISKYDYTKMKFRNGKIPAEKWKKAEDINKEDVLVCPLSVFQRERMENRIDLSEYLTNETHWKIYPEILFSYRATPSQEIKRYIDIYDPMFARLLGYYIAEGSVSDTMVHFCVNRNEQYIIDDIEQILNNIIFLHQKKIGYNFSNKDESVDIFSGCTPLAHLFSKICGTNAHHKVIPSYIMSAPKEIKKAFLKGLFRGDGTLSIKCVSHKTVSKVLAFQIRNILLSLGAISSLNEDDNSRGYGNGTIFTTKINRIGDLIKNDIFSGETISLQEEVNHKNSYIYIKEDKVYLPVRKVSRHLFKGKVYNLTVDEDNSYIAGGCAVHNCGEGYGLTAIEAMACGIPIIVPDNTVTPELFGADGDKAYIYPCKEHILIDGSGYRKTGRIEDIFNSMLTCYAKRNDPRQHSMLARAREFAVSLHWDSIAKQWDALLDKITTEQSSISDAKILTGGVEL